jgi:DNA-binding transcriptional ArsR family regulator
MAAVPANPSRAALSNRCLTEERQSWKWKTTMTRTSLTELREEMRGVARGERQASPLPAAPLLAALSRDALDLLGAVLRERPASVTALVALTGRAQPNISRSLQLLAKHRLIRLVREGREVRPEPIAGAVRVDFATGTYETTPARPVTA